MKLLLLCARGQVNEEIAGQIRPLAESDIDWQRLRRLARSHRVMPLLYRNLYRLCSQSVPAEVLDQLRLDYQTNVARNLLLSERLLGILDLFAAHGIEVIPYKGPVLAEAIYGDLGLRQFDDLDVILHKPEVLQAGELLLSMGYRPELGWLERDEKAFLKTEAECVFRSPDGAANLELHWRFAARCYGPGPDVRLLWGRLASVCLRRRQVPALAPEDRLLMLCVHGSTHLWGRLAWICDVAEMLRLNRKLDWDIIMEQARGHGLLRSLLLGLDLACELLGAPLEKRISGLVEGDPHVRMMNQKIGERLLADPYAAPGGLEKIIFHGRLNEHWTKQVAAVCRLLFFPTGSDFAFLRIPSGFSPLYPFLRLLRLAIKYVWSPLTEGNEPGEDGRPGSLRRPFRPELPSKEASRSLRVKG